ncbi:hypothetical protein TRVL_08260 [Trypanosoma vivax]|nr:hypothetical protein TRVL_08260 [Trypanosoma vivax]
MPFFVQPFVYSGRYRVNALARGTWVVSTTAEGNTGVRCHALRGAGGNGCDVLTPPCHPFSSASVMKELTLFFSRSCGGRTSSKGTFVGRSVPLGTSPSGRPFTVVTIAVKMATDFPLLIFASGCCFFLFVLRCQPLACCSSLCYTAEWVRGSVAARTFGYPTV